MMPPNFQPHSERLTAGSPIHSASRIYLPRPTQPISSTTPPTSGNSWKPEGSTHPVLTTPKGHRQRAHVFRRAGKAQSSSLLVPTHGCRTRPPAQASVSANACSARNVSLQLAGSLSHLVLGELRAPTQSVAGIHTNRPCSGTCTLAEACTGAPHCNLPGHPDRCGK